MSSPAPTAPAPTARPSLEIHHVFVGHGDATVILIRDKDKKVVHKTLIDASTSSGLNRLIRYFVKFMGGSDFDLLIPSHYHDDHLNGLGALGTGLEAKEVLDAGGYDLAADEWSEPATPDLPANPPLTDAEKSAMRANHIQLPLPPDAPYIPVDKAMFRLYVRGLRHAARADAIPPIRRRGVVSLDTLGVRIVLATIDGVPITLTPVAGNGYTIGPDRTRHTGGDPNNANNYSLAFILEYGAFRYFTGGDLGGEDVGAYYNHETPLAKELERLDAAHHGHVCAMKANHHGSNHSNNADLFRVLRPTVCITSVGTNKVYRLPGGEFLQRLNASSSPRGPQGFFFTQLDNFEDAARREEADKLFLKRPDTTYDGGTSAEAASYVIRVWGGKEVETKSVFSVYKIDAVVKMSDVNGESGMESFGEPKRLASFHCHG